MRLRATLLAAALLVAGCSGDGTASSTDGNGARSRSSDEGVALVALSTRPRMVSGDAVLVGLRGATTKDVKVAVDGHDVTDVFTEHPEAADVEVAGLVVGLQPGDHQVVARRGREQVASLDLTAYPSTGPIFSGPHQKPFVCTTEENGLGPAVDDDCSAPTSTYWLYFTDDPKAEPVPLDDPSAVPSDAATVERHGKQVPFVVRVERGVINRSIYEIAVLEPSPQRNAPFRSWDDSAWNHRLVYEFGGGCGTGYNQGRFLGHELNRDLMAAGYANVTSTLNVFQTACNDVLSAETAMMVKEHFIETYGVPVHTIGVGGSGGAIQQHLIAQNYPGILDAIQPSMPFPDAITIAPGVSDCGLLAAYWSSPEGRTFTDEQRLAVQGHGSLAFCDTWIRTFVDAVNPSKGCKGTISADLVYDPKTNPTGARCTLQDSGANLFPKDPATGFAERPLDNVGVQYGLKALRDGTISVDQFLDLNENIGSYDIDGNIVQQRVPAPIDAVKAAYAKGRVLHGESLLRIPMITANPYTDQSVDIHDRFRAFSVRDRMAEAAGGERPTNDPLWTRPGKSIAELVEPGSLPIAQMVEHLDQWLDAMARQDKRPADDDVAGWQRLLARTRPKGLTDDCTTPEGEHLASDDVYDGDNACTKAYPIHGDPRTAAGEPRRNDVVKCALRPADPSLYDGVTFTEEQATRLRAVFPEGVCDYTKPGIGQVPLEGTWLRYP